MRHIYFRFNLNLFFLLMSHLVLAQSQQIRGTVFSEAGSPLEGVSVSVNSKATTLTDTRGLFVLSAKQGEVLSFSFSGFSTQNFTVGRDSVISIYLKIETSELDEVVVVGYGEQRRRNITGAISTVDSKILENRPISTVMEALQGVVSGLSIVRESGQPGANDIDFKIRGTSTFSNNPVLTIIDGIPSALNTINPNDIESISVLKDAASTAIYGSRASGGVIIVTTKTGKKGRPRVNISSIISLQSPSRFPSIVSGHDHMIAQNEMRKNDGGPQKYSDEEIQASLSPEFKEWDWRAFMFNNALQTNQNVSISGGSEAQNYYASFGYLNQNGIFLNSYYQRFNFQFNQNISLTKNLKLRYKISYVPSKTIAPAVLNWGPIFQSSKLVGIKTDDGKWLTNSERVGDGRNALYAASSDGGQEMDKDNTILANISLDYDLTRNLSLNGSYGIVQTQWLFRSIHAIDFGVWVPLNFVVQQPS